MGKVARWLKGLLSVGGRKSGSLAEQTTKGEEAKERKRWVFASSPRDRERKGSAGGRGGAGRVGLERKPAYGSSPSPGGGGGGAGVPVPVMDEQNKRAIAVAAATAAVAEAAVAAAQAAAAVVRLTSSGRVCGEVVGRRTQEWAAIRIQAAFRGYLARRALKALRGLVKLQALVRGRIVRKQTTETFRRMQALVRAQARARTCRSFTDDPLPKMGIRFHHPPPPVPERYEPVIRMNGSKPERTGTYRRNAYRATDGVVVDPSMLQSPSWKWLDRWMEQRYWDSQGSSLSRAATIIDDEKNDKILEIDTGRPQLNSKCRNNYQPTISSSFAPDYKTPDTTSKDSMVAHRSILSPPSVDMQQSPGILSFCNQPWDPSDSPQFFSSSHHGSSRRVQFSPTRSECGRSFFGGYGVHPNYMAYTESAKAKARSHSAPKQRPEFEKSVAYKGTPVHGQSGNAAYFNNNNSSSSSQGFPSLHLKFAGRAYPGSGRLDRTGMPVGS